MLKDLTGRYPEVFTDKLGETKCDSAQSEADIMLEMGEVRPSTSPYASPIVMVKKKDGSNSVCVDFRKLNKITKVDPEPMTTAEDLFVDSVA